MSNFSITDFTTLINEQIQAHQDMETHLGQIEGVFEFVLTQDFSSVGEATFQSQWKNTQDLLCEGRNLNQTARTLNSALQATLTEKVLPQLVDSGKPA